MCLLYMFFSQKENNKDATRHSHFVCSFTVSRRRIGILSGSETEAHSIVIELFFQEQVLLYRVYVNRG
jgi:hypothetical protein